MQDKMMRFLRPKWVWALDRGADAAIGMAVSAWRLLPGSRHLRKPIFMMGCPRSGTTIAGRLFGQHPDVANYYSEAGRVWNPRHYVDPEADHHWTAADVTPADAARIHASFEFWRRLRRKPRFMNKATRTSVRIDYVRAVFPDAIFIHVIRDGRAVAHSITEYRARAPARLQRIPMVNLCKPVRWRELAREDWLEEAALQWREIVQFVLDRREGLRGAYHDFKYEDLCADPRGTLRRAFEFAGLDTRDEIMSRFPATLELQNLKWGDRLSEEQQRVLTEIQAPLLRRLGYLM